jgi:hypothetical protein
MVVFLVAEIRGQLIEQDEDIITGQAYIPKIY